MIAEVFQVMRFELQRSLTVGRVSMWILLWAFPTALMTTAVSTRRADPPWNAVNIICYILVPQVCCVLGSLLWATPAVQAELEGKTWIYLTLRPRGKVATLLGKYGMAVLWAGSASWIASWGLAFLLGEDRWLQLGLTLCGLSSLSCLAYAALYLLIGVTFTKRSMIAAVAYTLLVEVTLSLVPATINQLTISYRLRSLLAQWMKLDDLRSRTELFRGTESMEANVVILLGYATLLIVVAVFLLSRRELGPDADS